MSVKPIERLMYTQRGLCFFCEKPLAPAHATVEHLVAKANGGSNEDDNCVACCKSLNELFGSISLKAKLQVVLGHKGEFKCPNGAQKTTAKTKPAKSPVVASLNDKYAELLKNLKKSGAAKPRTLPKLKNTISAYFQRKISPEEVEALVQQLQSRGAISISGSKITYSF